MSHSQTKSGASSGLSSVTSLMEIRRSVFEPFELKWMTIPLASNSHVPLLASSS